MKKPNITGKIKVWLKGRAFYVSQECHDEHLNGYKDEAGKIPKTENDAYEAVIADPDTVDVDKFAPKVEPTPEQRKIQSLEEKVAILMGKKGKKKDED